MLPRWRFGEGEVILLATVQGLVSERERVRRAFHTEKPTVVALGVPPDMAPTLADYERKEGEDPFEDLADVDYVYSVKLGEFGPVDLPPPDLLEAARLAKETGLPLHGLDLTEDAYGELFTKLVSVWGFLRYGRIQRRLAKRPPSAPDARSFSLAWDAKIRKVKGIARVEAEREAHLAAGAARLARDSGGRVLFILDGAREEGVRARLAGLQQSS